MRRRCCAMLRLMMPRSAAYAPPAFYLIRVLDATLSRYARCYEHAARCCLRYLIYFVMPCCAALMLMLPLLIAPCSELRCCYLLIFCYSATRARTLGAALKRLARQMRALRARGQRATLIYATPPDYHALRMLRHTLAFAESRYLFMPAPYKSYTIRRLPSYARVDTSARCYDVSRYIYMAGERADAMPHAVYVTML